VFDPKTISLVERARGGLAMSLDPPDWAAIRVLGRRMVDDMLDYQETVRERPPWRTVPAEVSARLNEPVPLEGAPLAEIYESFRRDVHLTELQVRGIPVPSQTILGGRFAIRVCITNHRSDLSDFDALVEAVLALGEEILDRGPVTSTTTRPS
jgi:hypothetical protein